MIIIMMMMILIIIIIIAVVNSGLLNIDTGVVMHALATYSQLVMPPRWPPIQNW